MSSLIKTKGFTLIEAMIAIVVLLIGLVAVMSFFPLSLKVSGNSQDLTAASDIALMEIENLRGYSYDDIGVGTIETKHYLSTDPNNYLSAYQRQTAVNYVDSDLNQTVTDSGLKKIAVTIYWRLPSSKTEKTLEIDTLIASH
jgi:prepilin-type N-terminal cleavage/methylation domain-containing protein